MECCYYCGRRSDEGFIIEGYFYCSEQCLTDMFGLNATKEFLNSLAPNPHVVKDVSVELIGVQDESECETLNENQTMEDQSQEDDRQYVIEEERTLLDEDDERFYSQLCEHQYLYWEIAEEERLLYEEEEERRIRWEEELEEERRLWEIEEADCWEH